MKKFVILLLVFFFCSNAFAQNSIAVNGDTINRIDSAGKRQGYWILFGKDKKDLSYRPDAKWDEGNYKDSKKIGVWKNYYPNGLLKCEYTNVNGRPNGYMVTYYENGHKKEEGTFVGARWQGDYKIYYETDTLRQHFFYDSSGRLTGMQYYYHPNGKLSMSKEMKAGKETGWVKEYDESGNLIRKTYYDDGIIDVTETKEYPQIILYKIDTINRIDSLGKKQGFWIIFGKDKKDNSYKPDAKVEEGNFKDSKKIGIWKSYYPSGLLKWECIFVNGRPNGYMATYSENGHKEEEGTWVGTRWIGDYKMYYETDTLRQHFFYDSLGRRQGMQYFFHPNGKLRMSRDMKAGKENGWTKEYNESGNLIRETYYDNGIIDVTKTKEYPYPQIQKPVRQKQDTSYMKIQSNGQAITYFPDGHKMQEGVYKKNLWLGYYKLYYENGALRQHFFYDSLGRQQGVQYFYFPNGKLNISEEMIDGIENGWIKTYDENGKLIRERFYVNGVLDPSKSKDYPPIQKNVEQKQDTIFIPYRDYSRGTFNGEGNGIIYKNGQITMKGTFHLYKLINGEKRIYDTNGLLIQIKLYKNGEYVGDAPIPDDANK